MMIEPMIHRNASWGRNSPTLTRVMRVPKLVVGVAQVGNRRLGVAPRFLGVAAGLLGVVARFLDRLLDVLARLLDGLAHRVAGRTRRQLDADAALGGRGLGASATRSAAMAAAAAASAAEAACVGARGVMRMPWLPIWISTSPLPPGRGFSILMNGSRALPSAVPVGAEGGVGGFGGLGVTITRAGRVSTRSDMVQVKGGRSFRIPMMINNSSDSRKKRFQLIDTSQLA